MENEKKYYIDGTELSKRTSFANYEIKNKDKKEAYTALKELFLAEAKAGRTTVTIWTTGSYKNRILNIDKVIPYEYTSNNTSKEKLEPYINDFKENFPHIQVITSRTKEDDKISCQDDYIIFAWYSKLIKKTNNEIFQQAKKDMQERYKKELQEKQ